MGRVYVRPGAPRSARSRTGLIRPRRGPCPERTPGGAGQPVASASRTVERIFRTVWSGTSSVTPRTPANVQDTSCPFPSLKANAVALPSKSHRPFASRPDEVAVATLPVRPDLVVNGSAGPSEAATESAGVGPAAGFRSSPRRTPGTRRSRPRRTRRPPRRRRRPRSGGHGPAGADAGPTAAGAPAPRTGRSAPPREGRGPSVPLLPLSGVRVLATGRLRSVLHGRQPCSRARWTGRAPCVPASGPVRQRSGPPYGPGRRTGAQRRNPIFPLRPERDRSGIAYRGQWFSRGKDAP